MKVETYEIEDASTEASAMANDAAALELIEKLGLTGQKAIMNKETVTRIPYRAMEAREKLVWEAVCDEKRSLDTYQAEPIPLRVLQAAAFAKETEMFHKLEIWYPSVAKIDDPILVGITQSKDTRSGYEWNTITAFFLIARWGKSLLPFDELEAQAVKLLRTRRQASLTKIASTVGNALQQVASADIEELSRDVSLHGLPS